MKCIKLDLDGKDGLDVFLERAWIMKGFGLKTTNVMVYQTTHGYHVILELDNEIDNVKAVFMQLALGSDYRREVFNFLRIERGCLDWNVLFKEKYRVNKLGQKITVSEEKYDPKLTKKVRWILQRGVELQTK